MGLGVTLVFYVAVGLGVGAAVWMRGDDRLGLSRAIGLAFAVAFWPLFVPVLLAKPGSDQTTRGEERGDLRDEMARLIAQVDGELQSALASLEGWPEEVLARESLRIEELLALWSAQADRIREMDRLLARSESQEGGAPSGGDAEGRRRESELARRANLRRLAEVRDRSHAELLGTLAWVRELVSMIHLARFTGAPVSRAEELVGQIAAAVKGVSAVTWQGDGSREEVSFPLQASAAGSSAGK